MGNASIERWVIRYPNHTNMTLTTDGERVLTHGSLPEKQTLLHWLVKHDKSFERVVLRRMGHIVSFDQIVELGRDHYLDPYKQLADWVMSAP